MRRLSIMMLLASLLVACGGGASEPTSQSSEPTTAAATAAATNTPDNTVATVDASAANTSFASAAPLNGQIKASVNESNLYYRLDVPIGGVVTSTIKVDGQSPQGLSAILYDKNQSFLKSINLAPGETGMLGYQFGLPNGGQVVWEINGNALFSLAGSAAEQADAGSKGDAGNDFGKAVNTKVGSIAGSLGDADITDYFSIDVPKKGGTFTIDAKTTGDVQIQLFDETQNYLNNASATLNTPASFSRILNSEQGGRWFVRVDGMGSYDLALNFTAQADGASAGDAPDEIDQAVKVKPGTITGMLGDNDRGDIFTFDVPQTGFVYTLTATTKQGNLTIQTLDNAQNYMDQADFTSDAPVTIGRTLPGDRGPRWFIKVLGEGEYSLELVTVAQNDAGSNQDAGDEIPAAIVVTTSSIEGRVGNDDSDDYLRIPAKLGRKISVTVLGDGLIDVQLYDQARNYAEQAKSIIAGSAISLNAPEGDGDYFIQITNGEIAAQYRIEIQP